MITIISLPFKNQNKNNDYFHPANIKYDREILNKNYSKPIFKPPAIKKIINPINKKVRKPRISFTKNLTIFMS